jgi:hypothetical protein
MLGEFKSNGGDLESCDGFQCIIATDMQSKAVCIRNEIPGCSSENADCHSNVFGEDCLVIIIHFSKTLMGSNFSARFNSGNNGVVFLVNYHGHIYIHRF